MKSPAYTTQGLEIAFREWQNCLRKYKVLKEYSFSQIGQDENNRTVAILGEFLAPIPETFPKSVGQFKELFPYNIGAKFRASINMKRQFYNDPCLALELGTKYNFSVCNEADWHADFADPAYANEMIRRWRELGLDETDLSSLVIKGHNPRALSTVAKYVFPENTFIQYSKDFDRMDGTAIRPVGEAYRQLSMQRNKVEINIGEIDERLPELFSGLLKGVVTNSGEAVLHGREYRRDNFDLAELDGLWKVIGSASTKAAETMEGLLWKLKLDHEFGKRGVEVPPIDAKFVDGISLGTKWNHDSPSMADSGYLIRGRSNYASILMPEQIVPDSMKERLGQDFIMLSADIMIRAFREHIAAEEAKAVPEITT